jgi:hypothetical protein
MSALVRSVASLYCQGLRRTVRLGGGATAGTPAARAPALDQRRPFLSRVDRMYVTLLHLLSLSPCGLSVVRLPAAEFAVVVSCAERPPPAAAAAARRTREDHHAGMAKKEQPLSSPGTQLASPSRAVILIDLARILPRIFFFRLNGRGAQRHYTRNTALASSRVHVHNISGHNIHYEN